MSVRRPRVKLMYLNFGPNFSFTEKVLYFRFFIYSLRATRLLNLVKSVIAGIKDP